MAKFGQSASDRGLYRVLFRIDVQNRITSGVVIEKFRVQAIRQRVGSEGCGMRSSQEDNLADWNLMLQLLGRLFNDLAAVGARDDVDGFAR